MAIEFNCSGCGEVFEVADEMAGRKGKCPSCGVINLIPHAEDVRSDSPRKPAANIASRPGAKRPPAAVVGDSEIVEVDVEVDEASLRSGKKKRPKKRLWPLLLGVGLLGVLLASCGVGGYFLYAWYFGAPLGSEQRYFPNDTQLVVSVKVEQGMNSDLIKQLRNEYKPADKKDDPFDDASAEKEYGIPLSNIDRITFAATLTGKDEEHADHATILRTRKSVKGSDIKSNIEKRTFDETTLDKFTIYQCKDGFHDSFCVAEDKIVVYGPYGALKRLLDRGKKPDLPEVMETALKNADFSKTMAFAVNVKDTMKFDKADANGQKPLKYWSLFLAAIMVKDDPKEKAELIEKLLGKVDSLSGSVTVKSDATLSATLICKDVSTAEDIKKILDGGIASARDKVKEIKDDADASKESLTEAANNVTFTQNGNSVTANLVLKGDPLVKYFKKSMEKNAESRLKMEKMDQEMKKQQLAPPKIGGGPPLKGPPPPPKK